MSALFEVVRTNAGWHGRFVAANGQPVWTTEVYTRRRGALRAVAVIDTEAAADAARPERIRDVDERYVPPPECAQVVRAHRTT